MTVERDTSLRLSLSTTMSALHDLPLLSQLTACDIGTEDPIERFYLNSTDREDAIPWRVSTQLLLPLIIPNEMRVVLLP